MDPRDDDIHFDFFEDEPATTESQSTRGRLPRRGGRGTGMRPSAGGTPHGLTPMLRLLALLAIVVALLVFFGLLLQSCASTSKHDKAKHYMDSVGTIARSSQDDGTAVANALITPGVKADALAAKLRNVAEQERQNVTAAQHLNAPGPLRDQNQQLVEALQLRVSGVQGLADTFAANPALEDARARRPCSPSRPTGCSRATSSGTTSSRTPLAASCRNRESAASCRPTRTSSRTAT